MLSRIIKKISQKTKLVPIVLFVLLIIALISVMPVMLKPENRIKLKLSREMGKFIGEEITDLRVGEIQSNDAYYIEMILDRYGFRRLTKDEDADEMFLVLADSMNKANIMPIIQKKYPDLKELTIAIWRKHTQLPNYRYILQEPFADNEGEKNIQLWEQWYKSEYIKTIQYDTDDPGSFKILETASEREDLETVSEE